MRETMTDIGPARTVMLLGFGEGGAAMSLSLLKFVGQASLVDEAMLPS